ncbi:hypothetical protein D7243_22650 [Stutzerimonas stutzeri]|nr:hypothetical protein [Stutzerimonas stutzeri]
MSEPEKPYTYEELTFARTVRSVAADVRSQRAPKAARDDHESNIERERWLAQNPIESFYEEIVTNVLDTADRIRGIISQRNG